MGGVHRRDAPPACRRRQPRRQRWPQHQGPRQAEHAAVRRRDGVQEGHHAWADQGVRCPDPGSRYPERDQGWVLADRLRALRSLSVPYLQAQVEDGPGDGRQEDGGPALAEVERDGAVQLPAAAAFGLRHLQELRGPLPRCLHGRQRCCNAWQGHLVRAQGRGWWRRRQEEVSAKRCTLIRHNAPRKHALTCTELSNARRAVLRVAMRLITRPQSTLYSLGRRRAPVSAVGGSIAPPESCPWT